ncbi:MAG: hypothetical protein GY780_05200 [bacterium]|nr:hypothetical protein [bacterium]
MMIPFLFGIRTIKIQRQAFRHDLCLNCKKAAYSTLTRSMTFGAVLFIPVLPLGIRTKWLCDECGENPHSLKRTRLPFKFAGLIILAITMWASFQDTERGSDPTVDGVFRVIIAGLILFTLFSIRKHSAAPDWQQEYSKSGVSRLPPDLQCPYCRVNLQLEEGKIKCPACKLVRSEISDTETP